MSSDHDEPAEIDPPSSEDQCCKRCDPYVRRILIIAAVVLALALIGLALGIRIHKWSKSLDKKYLEANYQKQNIPTFTLEYVSVSLLNVSNDHSQETSTSEWFLKFSVSDNGGYYGCYETTFVFDHIDVYVKCLTGTSTVATIPPFVRNCDNFSSLPTMNATVRVPLPSFNTTYVELPFEVHMEAPTKYENAVHLYPYGDEDGYIHAKCRGMRIGIVANAVNSTLLGVPYQCPEYWN